ncbi:DUF2075 domain-containing protein, partial [Macrococcus equipercicus]
GNEIEECELGELVSLLEALSSENYQTNLKQIIKPNNYLVSPFNDVDLFMNSKYFLAPIQNERKKLFLSSPHKYFTVSGPAGSGKSLFIYDLAKTLYSENKNIKIIHCGYLNSGHETLNSLYGWDICMAHPNTIEDKESFSNLDVLFIDETQRLYNNQLRNLIEYSLEYDYKIVFSFDNFQILSNSDPARENELYINNNLENLVELRLNDKIRSNADINIFTKQIFNFQPNRKQVIKKVTIEYIIEDENVMNFIQALEEKDWVYIPFTRSRDNISYHRYCYHNDHLNSHRVIGQEFDKVVVILDSSFYFDVNNISYRGDAYYLPRQMLYQNMTRAKEQLKIVIVNNFDLYKSLNRIAMGLDPQ